MCCIVKSTLCYIFLARAVRIVIDRSIILGVFTLPPSQPEEQGNDVLLTPVSFDPTSSSSICWSFLQTDLERLDPRGRTPLHLAVTLGHLDCARVLLQHGADVSKENRNGWTGECVYTIC